MSSPVDDAVKIYRHIVQYPTAKYGRISMEDTPGHLQVYSEWSQRDLERSEMTKFARGHIVQLDVVVPTPPHQVADVLWNRESPSGRYRAIVRKVTDKKGDEKQWFEIWCDSRRLHNIDIAASEKHGKVYDNDGQFGALRWSHSETQLLYVAERKTPKTKSYFDTKPESANSVSADGSAPVVTKGDEFVYRDNWGEQLSEKAQPVLCILDIKSGDIRVLENLENLPKNVSLGQASWCPGDSSVVCVGWYNDPYRLGIIYCSQRRSALFHIDLKNHTCTTLGPDDRAVNSPVFSPDGSKLVFLDQPAGGPHRQCSRLMMCDWSTKGILPVVEIVNTGLGTEEFPGLFTDGLGETCWSTDSKRIVVSSLWRSRTRLLVIHVETGEVIRLSSDPLVGNWKLLDVQMDLILAACASPSQPDYLVIGKLPPAEKESEIQWLKLDPEPSAFKQMAWKIVPVPVPEARVHPDYILLDYEYILVEPRTRDEASCTTPPPPLAVFIHGGPHSAFVADFQPYVAGLCLCGYTVLMVNYRGSIGFGQDSVKSLLGRIGCQDVCDVQSVVEQIVATGTVDKDEVVVIGGSHGGFLTAHVIGQFPKFYRAAVARNPVINLASMVGCSDIPDWVFTECGLEFDPKNIPTANNYSEFLSRSPIIYADRVQTPLMLMIGGKDLRVPPSQGLEMKKALESRGAAVRVMWYPDCSHPLSDVKSEADAFVNIVKWFAEHINRQP